MSRSFTKYPSNYIQASKVNQDDVSDLQMALWNAFMSWENSYLECSRSERDAFVNNNKAYRKIFDALGKVAQVGVKFWATGIAAIEKQNKKNR